MICVKIELWPHGDEERKSEIGRMFIANVGGTVERGEYVAAVCRRGTTEPPNTFGGTPSGYYRGRATRTANVHRYPRLAYNVWRLVLRSLVNAFPEDYQMYCDTDAGGPVEPETDSMGG